MVTTDQAPNLKMIFMRTQGEKMLAQLLMPFKCVLHHKKIVNYRAAKDSAA